MKKLMYFSVALFAISILACQDGKEDAKNIADLSFYRSIGKQISTQTGYRWMDLYRSRLNLAGREKPSGYALSKANLAELTSSVEQLVGVTFQHALDETGNHHFLVIPIDETLQIWSHEKLMIDSNTDSVVSYEDARQWARNYQSANPDQIWYHFFGKHVFDEMNAIPFFEYIQVEPAISDVNFIPQVLLIVNDLDFNESTSAGRGELEEAVVYDVSTHCPPQCSLEDAI